jgi:fatty-acyl-CoA synthase
MRPRVEGVDGIDYIDIADVRRISEIAALGDREEQAEDVAIVLFTSGATSEPKAAILRHKHLTSYVVSTLKFGGAEEDEASLISVPPYHIVGISAVVSSTYIGRRIVMLPVFTPEGWIKSVIEEKITHAMVVPTMLGRIMEDITRGKISLPSLRSLSYGGGRMPSWVIERALDILPHVEFVNAYGVTETSSTISVLDSESHRAAFNASDPVGRKRLSSVGRPLPSIEIEIRDDRGRPIPAGFVGEIWVRGDQIAGEYVGRDAKRADDWFPTNDAGYMDEEGFLYLEGRLDDIIVRGAENISPGEVEEMLLTYPGLKDAAVFGVPDEEWGERVVAAVVAEPGASEEDLKRHVRSQLRSSRVPQSIIFRSELPYNEMGKLLRRALKAEVGICSV